MICTKEGNDNLSKGIYYSALIGLSVHACHSDNALAEQVESPGIRLTAAFAVIERAVDLLCFCSYVQREG